MRLHSLISRHRLLVSFFALALAIGALAVTPTVNAQICDTGCVAWDINNGCTRYMTCCVNSPSDWACIEWGPVS